MVLADMAAMNRIRDRIAEEQAAKERAALAQSQEVGKPVLGEEQKNGLSQAVVNKMLVPQKISIPKSYKLLSKNQIKDTACQH